MKNLFGHFRVLSAAALYLVSSLASLPEATPQLALFGRMENVFDCRSQQIYSHPTPTRTWSLGVRLEP